MWLGVISLTLTLAGLYIWWKRSVPPIVIPRIERDHQETPSHNNTHIEARTALQIPTYDNGRPSDRSPEFEIEYADADGIVTRRSIEILSLGNSGTFQAWCFMRSERRTFLFERILSARNLRTGRQIGNLGNYLRRNW